MSELPSKDLELRKKVLAEMEKKPGDCELFDKLTGMVADNKPLPDDDEMAIYRLLAATHLPQCKDQKHKSYIIDTL